MSPKSYNIILMRDDAHVRRFRLKAIWFKVSAYLAVCILLAAAFSIWAALTLWSGNKALRKDIDALQETAHENAVELQRLQNMELMLKKVADPLGEHTVLETLTQGVAPEAPGSPSDVDLNAMLAEKNTGRAKVEKVSLRQGQHHWTLSFELSNPDKDNALEGLYLIQVVATNGTHHNVTLDKEQVHFRIQRFKKIEMEFSLPPSLQQEDIFGVRLVIDELGGATVFSKAWQLSSILRSS